MNIEDYTGASRERENLNQAIAALEAQRSVLGDQVVDIALSALREKLDHLLSQGSQQPQERKLITVLFADVSGFTAMADTMDHEIVGDVIDSLWSRVDKANRS